MILIEKKYIDKNGVEKTRKCMMTFKRNEIQKLREKGFKKKYKDLNTDLKQLFQDIVVKNKFKNESKVYVV